MKFMTFCLSLLFVGSALAAPHLDLELSSGEYRKLLAKQRQSFMDDPAIVKAIFLGDRLSKWINAVNATRTPTTAIRLTSAATRRGVPIDRPNIYSPTTINKENMDIQKELPMALKEVLLTSAEISSTIPVSDEIFILHARRIDRNYQQAARYKSIDKYRTEYIKAARNDVRGYYYLVSKKIGEHELRDVALIPPAKVAPIKEALTLLCVNGNKATAKCQQEMAQAFTTNAVAAYYKKYLSVAKENWDQFFYIPMSAKRSDIDWSGSTTTVPFNTPALAKFIPYLKTNIEDEFRWLGWSLKLNFGKYTDGPYLTFEAGALPHVNALGGNEIVMDSNQPIEEYESQWTIRHEFGHILGLPDCYHEFYDVDARAYVNYQLDTKDLMCSRAGNMNARIFTELKMVYEN
jgi:hypothetical protein